MQLKVKLISATFLQAAVAGPILGIDFLRKFKVTVNPEINQIQFACSAAASPTSLLPSAAQPGHLIFSAATSASPFLFSSILVPAPVPIQLPTATTSSQPPSISAYVVRNPKVKLSSFNLRENQSLLEPPPSYKKITDSVSADIKTLFQKFPSILRTGDVKPTPTHGVGHHIHTSSHPTVFAKSRHLDLEKLQIAAAEFKRLESDGIVRRSKSPWASSLQMVPKKDGSWKPCGDYHRLNLVTTPTSILYQICKTFQQSGSFFQKSILSRVIAKSLSRPRTSQKLQS